jgi:hypothetical protein
MDPMVAILVLVAFAPRPTRVSNVVASQVTYAQRGVATMMLEKVMQEVM